MFLQDGGVRHRVPRTSIMPTHYSSSWGTAPHSDRRSLTDARELFDVFDMRDKTLWLFRFACTPREFDFLLVG